MTQRIGFITDSTCDLPPEFIDKYGITVVPAFINYNNNSYADDGVELVREKYYNDLPHLRPHPTTSAMSTGLAEEYIMRAAQDVDHLFVLTVPATLSGIYNAMRLALQRLPEDRYTLIDSGNLTFGLGWQLVIAWEIAQETGGDIDAIRKALKKIRVHTHVYCALETLEYLRRSGRVGWTAANIGALLQIKPMIHVYESEVKNDGRVRTFRRALDELAERVRKHAPLEKLAILHANNPSGARTLAEMIKDLMPPDTLTSIFITPAIGTNIGPGGVGAALVEKAWRNEPDHAIGT